jgi:hypothetical protein
LTTLSNLTSITGVISGSFAPVLGGAGIAVAASNFLYQQYQAMQVKIIYRMQIIIDIFLATAH